MVQSTAVSSLIALVSASPAPAAGGAEEGDSAQVFSQLLSDSGKQSSEQRQFRSKVVAPSAPSAVSAQEVPTIASDAARQLLNLREHEVTPQDAPALIARVDKILGLSRSPEAAQVLKQLKEQLQAIARGGETKTIGALVQSASVVADSNLSQVALTALLSPRKQEPATTELSQEEEELGAAALVQSVPAAIFHPHATDDRAAQAATDTAEAKRRDFLDTVSVITPLAAVTVSPALADTLKNDAFKARADLDTVIPPLTPPTAEAQTLPEISLPRLHEEVSAGTSGSSAANSATFENLLGNQTNIGESAAVANAISEPASPSGLAGHSGVSPLVRASEPVEVASTPGYVNQAPVSEQVHVAVRKAASDGLENITVQLDPIDLGRVEVNIQTNRDGQTSISFVVDKPETFDHLSRDARTLERALQESGIKTDTGSMQFNLRQQPQLHSDAGGDHRGQHAQRNDADEPTGRRSTAPITQEISRHYIFNVRDGVDISA